MDIARLMQARRERQVARFHGDHDQSSHGNRDGGGSALGEGRYNVSDNLIVDNKYTGRDVKLVSGEREGVARALEKAKKAKIGGTSYDDSSGVSIQKSSNEYLVWTRNGHISIPKDEVADFLKALGK